MNIYVQDDKMKRADSRDCGPTARPEHTGFLEKHGMSGEHSSHEFRLVPGFPHYRINAEGVVQCRLPRGLHRAQYAKFGDTGPWRTLLQRSLKKGYPAVTLYRDGETFQRTVGRLVLLAFVGEPGPGQECRHLNGNRLDNRLVNLAWGTKAENMADRDRHGTTQRGARHCRAKFTDDDIREIRRLRRSGMTIASVGARFGTSDVNVSYICNGKTWKHIPA